MNEDTAVVVSRDRPPPRRRRRFKLPGSSVLILMFGGVGLLAWQMASSSNDVTDVTVETWACAEPVTEQMTWTGLQSAGCEPADVGADIVLSERQGAEDPVTVNGSRSVFESVGTLTPELALQVDLPQAVGAVVLVSQVQPEPTVLGAMHGDASGTRWTSHLDADGNDTFLLLLAPAG